MVKIEESRYSYKTNSLTERKVAFIFNLFSQLSKQGFKNKKNKQKVLKLLIIRRYHWDILRPLILLEMRFRFKKKGNPHQNCSFLSCRKFHFFGESTKFWSEKALFRNITLLYAFYNIFFWENSDFFSKNPKFRSKRGILKQNYYLRRILENICCNLVQKNQSWKSDNLPEWCNWQINVKKHTLREKDFLSVLSAWAENNNSISTK